MLPESEVFLTLRKPEFVKIGKFEENNSHDIWEELDDEPEGEQKVTNILVIEEQRKFKAVTDPKDKNAKKPKDTKIVWHSKIRMYPFQKLG